MLKFRHFLPIALLCGVLTGALYARAQMWGPWVKGTPAAAGGGSTPSQWNSADAGTGFTVRTTSQTNDTVDASTSTWQRIRSTNAATHTTGKYHFEVIITAENSTSNGWMMGLDDGGGTLAGYCGSDATVHGFGLQPTPGSLVNFYIGNANAHFWNTAPAVGDHLLIEVDLPNKLMWWQDATKATNWSDNTGNTSTAGGFTGNPGNGTLGLSLAGMTTTPDVKLCWSGNGTSPVNTAQVITKVAGFTNGAASISTGFTAWDPP